MSDIARLFDYICASFTDGWEVFVVGSSFVPMFVSESHFYDVTRNCYAYFLSQPGACSGMVLEGSK